MLLGRLYRIHQGYPDIEPMCRIGKAKKPCCDKAMLKNSERKSLIGIN